MSAPRTVSVRAPGELRFLHRRALAVTGGIVVAACAAPADEHVLDLVGTVTAGNLWAAELLGARSVVGAPSDPSWAAAAYWRSVDVVDEAACERHVLDATVTTERGTVTGAAVLADRFVAVMVAGWDIARRAGVAARTETDLVDAAVALVTAADVPALPPA